MNQAILHHRCILSHTPLYEEVPFLHRHTHAYFRWAVVVAVGAGTGVAVDSLICLAGYSTNLFVIVSELLHHHTGGTQNAPDR